MHAFKGLIQGLGATAIAALGLWVSTPQAHAAEEIVFRYGIIRQRLSVVELTKFAESGEQSPVLERYLERTNSNPDEIRQVLNRPLAINRGTLDKALNTVVGDLLLDELGKMIQTPNDEGNQAALKSSLLASAEQDNQVTILELIRNYPTEEIHLDVMRAVKTYERLARYQKPLQEALKNSGSIREMLQKQGITIPDFLK